MVVATKTEDGTMRLTHGVRCGVACECSEEVSSCAWEASHVPRAPGLHDLTEGEVDLLSFYCFPGPDGAGEAGQPAQMGLLEIARVDDDGVAGCIVDWDWSDLRFEATWCP
jgi:hypothetical protein